MSKAEQIIRKQIEELDERMKAVVSYELDMEEFGHALSQDELVENDRKWMQLAIIKCELQAILAEIKKVSIEDVVC